MSDQVMLECTKGPCDEPATEGIIVRDGSKAWTLYRCDKHGEVNDTLRVIDRRPVQATLQESTEP